MIQQIDPHDPVSTIDKDWWRGAVIYQIYPRSFQDSNGDGIGDLKGITQRLAYVASLGVDAVWISPFFTSPMDDFGYDVSDYCDIDPMFGNLADFDGMMAEAHRLGLKVMIDLVLSHSSDQHEWFEQSRQDKTNDKADWYVWADAKDGDVPNNWLSIFGGSAWQWDETREQYYLHNFLSSQPDLNLHNMDVQNALLDVERFWLNKGVDGFRLDTINFYFHDPQLRDNPILPPEARNDTIAPSVNPYNHQDHLYDKNQPENIAFLKRFRAVMEEYPAIAAVGEVGDAQYGMKIMSDYTAGDDLMQMCYSFDFLSGENLQAARVGDVLQQFSTMSSDSWSCWAFSNHDVERHVSRWQLDTDSQKLLNSLLLSLQGSVCIYQGEELGLAEAEIKFEDLQDPYGKEFWPKFKGRDGCRTPMVWVDDEVNAGFSEAKPWLPISASHVEKAVSTQEMHKGSMLNSYRQMIEFRKNNPALAKGSLNNLQVSEHVVSFDRDWQGKRIFCAFNMSDDEQIIAIDGSLLQTLDGLDYQYELSGNQLTLPAWQAFYADRNE
ncbi:MAG: DUF3459 domain-containing protein [OCS116 cluster bacterium]|uniref:Alpha-glucosidase n=1 Tax=OCS116 cluster bacterium TaxID=2030921 RepID=A0A2A4YXV4_9PROT|nr:DUF3459 domain-containing protein [OCS116 cluster bacterium]